MFREKFLNIEQILLHGDKGAGYIVHTLLYTEENIALILLGKELLTEHLAREAHAFSVAKLTTADNLGFHKRRLHADDAEAHKSVIEQYHISAGKLLCHARIRNGNNLLIADKLLGGKCKIVAVSKIYKSVFKCFYAVFRSLCIEHYRDGKSQLFAHLFYQIYFFKMLCLRAV